MRIIKIAIIAVLVAGLASGALCEDTRRTAKIIDITGQVKLKLAGEQDFMPAQVGMTLGEWDLIKTYAGSSAILNLDGEAETATVELDENSELILSELIEDKDNKTQQTLLDLAVGKILIKAQKLHSEDSRFEIKTPTSVVGVRGTTFAVEVEALE